MIFDFFPKNNLFKAIWNYFPIWSVYETKHNACIILYYNEAIQLLCIAFSSFDVLSASQIIFRFRVCRHDNFWYFPNGNHSLETNSKFIAVISGDQFNTNHKIKMKRRFILASRTMLSSRTISDHKCNRYNELRVFCRKQISASELRQSKIKHNNTLRVTSCVCSQN